MVPALLHAGAWVLMIAAMMLPTTFPLLAMFRRISGSRPDAGRLLALVVLGYFAAWLAFGLIAHLADAALRVAAARYAWFVAHGWIVGAAVLVAAGLFQWSALKYRCLEECRTPFGFVASRWRGRSPSREALRIGVDHGLFCVGCCWALMLMMFVVGHRQRRLDAGAGRGDGRREEPADRAPPAHAGGCRAPRLGRRDRPGQRLTAGLRERMPFVAGPRGPVTQHRRRTTRDDAPGGRPWSLRVLPLSRRCNACGARPAFFVASVVESPHNARLSILQPGRARSRRGSATASDPRSPG